MPPVSGQGYREAWGEAAGLGLKGLVLDATGELAPRALSETARRDIRGILQTMELALVALHLPTRRPFDNLQDLDDRLARAEQAFELAYGLGSKLVLANVGTVPPDVEPQRLADFKQAIQELGRRAERRGVRLAIEVGRQDPARLAGVLGALANPGLAVSVDPSALSASGYDPARAVEEFGERLGHAYAMAAETLARPRAGFLSEAITPCDWPSFLGALEEVGYRGFLTIWPEPGPGLLAALRRHVEALVRV